MYRRAGIIVLILGALSIYVLAFVPFETTVRRYTRDDAGDRVRATAVCPNSVEMMWGEAEPDVKYLSDVKYCLKGARLRLSIAAGVGVLALALGIRGLVRGPRPDPIHLRPLSELFDELKKVAPGPGP